MSDKEKIEALEKRVHNLEALVIGYLTITEDLLPTAYNDSVGRLQVEFADHQEKLGAFEGELFKS